jgi:hypothetical protein
MPRLTASSAVIGVEEASYFKFLLTPKQANTSIGKDFPRVQ